MNTHTTLLIIKIALAVVAITLAIMKGKSDKQIMFYWILVTIYWSLNALSDCIH